MTVRYLLVVEELRPRQLPGTIRPVSFTILTCPCPKHPPKALRRQKLTIMAMRSLIRLPHAASRSLNAASRSSLLASQNALFAARASHLASKSVLQHTYRRTYTDQATPIPKKRAGFFRWTWRLTKLAALGAVGSLAYQIYDLRNPDDQFEPDPSKKTLVVLGESASTRACSRLALTHD